MRFFREYEETFHNKQTYKPYHVNATLYLKDQQTGATIFEKTYDREDDDRYANALHAMFGDFYREADERLGNT